jgi:hypothetical protein
MSISLNLTKNTPHVSILPSLKVLPCSRTSTRFMDYSSRIAQRFLINNDCVSRFTFFPIKIRWSNHVRNRRLFRQKQQ